MCFHDDQPTIGTRLARVRAVDLPRRDSRPLLDIKGLPRFSPNDIHFDRGSLSGQELYYRGTPKHAARSGARIARTTFLVKRTAAQRPRP